MDARELRLGNLATINNPEYHPQMKDVPMVVTSISELQGNLDPEPYYSIRLEQVNKNKYEWCVFSQMNKYVEPIPLTKYWLLRFGLEKREQGVCDYFHIGINELTHDWLFDLVWLKKIEGGYEDFPFYRNGKFIIRYVHQLQNLYFALTGEELTINNTVL